MTHPNSGTMGATGGLQGGGTVSDFKRCSPRGEETVGQRWWNLGQSEKVSCVSLPESSLSGPFIPPIPVCTFSLNSGFPSSRKCAEIYIEAPALAFFPQP